MHEARGPRPRCPAPSETVAGAKWKPSHFILVWVLGPVSISLSHPPSERGQSPIREMFHIRDRQAQGWNMMRDTAEALMLPGKGGTHSQGLRELLLSEEKTKSEEET